MRKTSEIESVMSEREKRNKQYKRNLIRFPIVLFDRPVGTTPSASIFCDQYRKPTTSL